MGIRKPFQKLLSSAVVLPTLLLSSPPMLAEQAELQTEAESVSAVPKSEQRLNVRYDTYILGPGDRLQIELLDLPELSGEFTIGPDGTFYLPRLRALQVEGLTIEELRLFLTEQFRPYVRQPEVFITPVGYRPVRVYVGGEVARPGYYTISGSELANNAEFFDQQKRFELSNTGTLRARPSASKSLERSTAAISRTTPTFSTPSKQPAESRRSLNSKRFKSPANGLYRKVAEKFKPRSISFV